MSRLWEFLPLIVIVLLVFLAGYLLLAPGPWRVGYPVRFLAGGILLAYALARGVFWYRRWKKRRSFGV
jgi:hypothetical protein